MNPDAAIKCDDDKNLFEVDCDVKEGFKITVNDNCRKMYYQFIDFENSFVWGKFSSLYCTVLKSPKYLLFYSVDDSIFLGNSSIQAMNNPTGSKGIDVDPGFNQTCDNVKMEKDSGSWSITVPFGNCDINQTDVVNNITKEHYVQHALYWNSQWPTFPKLYQADQVELLCRVDSTQLNAASITVGANEDMISKDPIGNTTNVEEIMVLKVWQANGTLNDNSLKDVGYTEKNETNIGDHVKLELTAKTGYKETFDSLSWVELFY